MVRDARIQRVKRLNEDNISSLIEDRSLALIVENYYPQELCERLSKDILASSNVEKYTHEVIEENDLVQKYFGVDRLGMPFNLLYNIESKDDPLVMRYYETAKESIDLLRRFTAPAATPIDKLRLELDEAFVPGASIAAFEGKKMLAGIARITKASLSYMSADQPHFDALPSRYANLEAQLAANIYLKVPDAGGELELWDVPPTDPLSEAPIDWRSALPQSVRIRPEKGDLILFNCRRPHAVLEFSGEDRVSVQMFIGYKKGQPLMFWN